MTGQCRDKHALKKLTTTDFAVCVIFRYNRRAVDRRRKRNHRVSRTCILYCQRSSTHADITAARNRHRMSIDAGCIFDLCRACNFLLSRRESIIPNGRCRLLSIARTAVKQLYLGPCIDPPIDRLEFREQSRSNAM